MASIIKVDQIETDVNLTGSASAPSLYPMNDTNTGVFFPAADTVAISTGGTERLRVNSSGNLVVTGTTDLSNVTVSGTVSGTYTLGGTPTISSPTISSPVLSGTATGTYTLGGTPSLTATALTGTIAAARLPTGSVLQVVQANSTNQTTTTSSNFQATGHSVTITPSSSSSKILLLHQGMVNSQASSVWCWGTIYRNASVNLYSGGAYDAAGGIYTNNSSDSHCPMTFATLDSPNTTSATTYTIYFKNNNNSSAVRYNADAWKLYFIAMEIAG